MATTVNSAFQEFLTNHVNLNSTSTASAISSRDWLKGQIQNLDNFFPLYSEKDISFGSFARKTKIKPLDDIDLIVTLAANGCTWGELGDTVYLTVPDQCHHYQAFKNASDNFLNSTKVINHFIRQLKTVHQYGNADLHKNMNAATLKLSSYEWNFDIVPALFTAANHLSRTFYLIPDGKGNWLKTDPRMDKERATCVNKNNGGYVLTAIRLMKYWNKRPTMPIMSSYLLENIVLDYYGNLSTTAQQWQDLNVRDLLNHISAAIHQPVYDPKGIQGDLNTISYLDRCKIAVKAQSDFMISLGAIELEANKNYRSSINEWRRVFGSNFPRFG